MGPGEEPAMSEETIETVPPSADELAYAEAEAGEHAKAGLTFGKLGDYKDARNGLLRSGDRLAAEEQLPMVESSQNRGCSIRSSLYFCINFA